MVLESTAVQNWQIYQLQCVGSNRSFKKFMENGILILAVAKVKIH